MLSIVLLSCFTLHEFCVHYGLAAGQAVSQVLFWVLLLLLCLASPHPIFRGLRHFVARRTITFVTGAKVEFIDVLTADALTSMSKLLADMQVRQPNSSMKNQKDLMRVGKEKSTVGVGGFSVALANMGGADRQMVVGEEKPEDTVRDVGDPKRRK